MSERAEYGSGLVSRAQAFGAESWPGPLRDAVIAFRMLRRNGLGATWDHAKTVGLVRAHRALIDRRRQRDWPKALDGETLLGAFALRATSDAEVQAAVHCAGMPTLTFRWAMAASGLDLSRYHFVDVGSGWGCALMLAADHPFHGLTGVEFARELHEMAEENLAWATAQGRIRQPVDLRHESALETRLPDGPVMLFLANPFGEPVMRPFLERVREDCRRNPRPIVAIYVNPVEARLFEQPGIEEMRLRGRGAQLLKLFSPFAVRAYRIGG